MRMHFADRIHHRSEGHPFALLAAVWVTATLAAAAIVLLFTEYNWWPYN